MVQFLGDVHKGFPKLIVWLEGLKDEVTEDDWTEFKQKSWMRDSKGDNWDPDWMAGQIYSTLVQKTAGDPKGMIRNLGSLLAPKTDPDDEDTFSDLRGLLGWQRVHRDAQGWNAARRRALNQKVHSPSRVTNLVDVPRALEEWAASRTKFEVLEERKLALTTVLSSMRSILPKDLEDKAMTLSGTLDDEQKLKKFVLGQCFEARPADSGKALKNLEQAAEEEENEEEEKDGELNAAWQGKGGGGGYFEGACAFCEQWGHKKAHCRKLDRIMEQKRAEKGGGAKSGGKGFGSEWHGGWNDAKGSTGFGGKSGGKGFGGSGGKGFGGGGKGYAGKSGGKSYGKQNSGGKGWGRKGYGKSGGGLHLNLDELFYTEQDAWYGQDGWDYAADVALNCVEDDERLEADVCQVCYADDDNGDGKNRMRTTST